MSIPVQCPACRRRFSAPDRGAGRTAHCPACQHRIVIPGTRIAAPPDSDHPARPASSALTCPACGTMIPVPADRPHPENACSGCGVAVPAGQVACRRCQLAARQIRWEQQQARARMPESALLVLEPDELVVCVARGKNRVYAATDCRLLIAPRPRRLPVRGGGCTVIEYPAITGYEEFDDLSDRARIIIRTTAGEHVLDFDDFDEFHRLSVQWPAALALHAGGRRGPEYALISLPC